MTDMSEVTDMEEFHAWREARRREQDFSVEKATGMKPEEIVRLLNVERIREQILSRMRRDPQPFAAFGKEGGEGDPVVVATDAVESYEEGIRGSVVLTMRSGRQITVRGTLEEVVEAIHR